MIKQHCGCDMHVDERHIAPTIDESTRGVKSLRVLVCWCQVAKCRQRKYYAQELYEIGHSALSPVKKNIAVLTRRLKQAKESDWVWGYDRETYAKVKRPVK